MSSDACNSAPDKSAITADLLPDNQHSSPSCSPFHLEAYGSQNNQQINKHTGDAVKHLHDTVNGSASKHPTRLAKREDNSAEEFLSQAKTLRKRETAKDKIFGLLRYADEQFIKGGYQMTHSVKGAYVHALQVVDHMAPAAAVVHYAQLNYDLSNLIERMNRNVNHLETMLPAKLRNSFDENYSKVTVGMHELARGDLSADQAKVSKVKIAKAESEMREMLGAGAVKRLYSLMSDTFKSAAITNKVKELSDAHPNIGDAINLQEAARLSYAAALTLAGDSKTAIATIDKTPLPPFGRAALYLTLTTKAFSEAGGTVGTHGPLSKIIKTRFENVIKLAENIYTQHHVQLESDLKKLKLGADQQEAIKAINYALILPTMARQAYANLLEQHGDYAGAADQLRRIKTVAPAPR